MKTQLWVEFFYTFPLVQHFIQLECTGGWFLLHLEITSPEKMYLYHASGLVHYAKLVYLYHLKMSTLQDMDKDEFHSYTEESLLTIRCSDRFWGGVWCDMATEQALTRTKMVSGELTWGCRITENTLAKWACASFYTTVYPNWGAQWQVGWTTWTVLWGMSPQRLETSPTGRSGALRVDHRSSSTALWAVSWRYCFTVFWHYWWLLSELP